jgi:hypothetical protein
LLDDAHDETSEVLVENQKALKCRTTIAVKRARAARQNRIFGSSSEAETARVIGALVQPCVWCAECDSQSGEGPAGVAEGCSWSLTPWHPRVMW